MRSRQIERITIQAMMNLSLLVITYFQFLKIMSAKMKLRGSHLPRQCTQTERKASRHDSMILVMIIPLTSSLAILCGCLYLIPHMDCRYSYYFCFSSALLRLSYI